MEAITSKSNRSFRLFFIKAISFYAVWYIFRAFYLSPFTHFDAWFIERLVKANAWILNEVNGYAVYLVSTEPHGYLDAIFAQDAGGIKVGLECDGIGVISTFMLFILAFPGKNKLLFAFTGGLTIHLLNLLRVWVLTLLQIHYPSALDFNHKYTFNILIYSSIFVLWYVYAKYFKK
jgi:exosortase/archaeosortase family protein